MPADIHPQQLLSCRCGLWDFLGGLTRTVDVHVRTATATRHRRVADAAPSSHVVLTMACAPVSRVLLAGSAGQSRLVYDTSMTSPLALAFCAIQSEFLVCQAGPKVQLISSFNPS